MNRLLPLVLVAAGIAVAGCGSDDKTSSSSSTAPERNASAEPISRGWYAGVSCSNSSCSEYPGWDKWAKLWCEASAWQSGSYDFSPHGTYPPPSWPRKPSYVCFKLVPANRGQTQATPNLVTQFYLRNQKILTQGHVSSDRFSTSENGWNIDGEWFGPEDVRGGWDTPSGVRGYYNATWYSS